MTRDDITRAMRERPDDVAAVVEAACRMRRAWEGTSRWMDYETGQLLAALDRLLAPQPRYRLAPDYAGMAHTGIVDVADGGAHLSRLGVVERLNALDAAQRGKP